MPVSRNLIWESAKLLTIMAICNASGLLLSASAQAADWASSRIISECGAESVDEFSIAACVTLRSQQAEATLIQAEDAWQSLLLQESPGAEESLLEASPLKSTDSDLSDGGDESSGSTVIAIVNNSALQAGVSTGDRPVINIDRAAGYDGHANDLTGEAFDTSVDNSERFGFLPALFRSYRDQQCAWRASLFGSDRTQLHYRACLTAMTLARVQELNHYLAAQRALARRGSVFRGYFVKTDSGALFQACDRKTNWWVVGSASVLSAIDRRFFDIKSQNFAGSELLYAELHGEVTRAPDDGPGADFSAALNVRSVNLLRPLVETDCAYRDYPTRNQPAAQSADSGISDSSISDSGATVAATVDDYASSGFLYGYFNNWLAACSVSQNSVCSAETQAQFASDGEWLVRVDRSLAGDWRVKLVPTTDDQLIESRLTLQINGAEVYLEKSFAQPLKLMMRNGLVVADGEAARELVAKLKQGRELRFQWFDDADVMSELKFSLLGITRALQYFDGAG